MTAMIAFLGPLGPTETIVILLIVVILFGAKKIPDLAKGIGQGIKEFKKASKEIIEDEDEDEAPKIEKNKIDKDV